MNALLFVDQMCRFVDELHQGVQVTGPLVQSVGRIHVQPMKKDIKQHFYFTYTLYFYYYN